MEKKIVFAFAAAWMLLSTAEAAEDFSSQEWKQWKEPKASVSFSRKGTEAQIRMEDGNPDGKGGILLRSFPAEPDTHYRASATVSGKDADAGLSIQAFTGNNRIIAGIGKARGRTEDAKKTLVCDFKTAPKTEMIKILLSVAGKPGSFGTFHDFHLEKLDLSREYKDGFGSSVWNFWKAEGARMKGFHSPTEGRTEKGAAVIEVEAGNPENKTGCFTRTVPVRPGREYTFLVYVKCSGFTSGGQFSLGYQAQNAKGRFLGTPVRSAKTDSASCADWKRIVLTSRIPDTGKWKECAQVLVTLAVRSASAGSVWYDDFEFFDNEAE